MEEKIKLRDKLVDIALQWQACFRVAPSITGPISEWTAAVDKMDDYVLVKLVNSKNDFIHLCMLPTHSTSIIWYDISELYKIYE